MNPKTIKIIGPAYPFRGGLAAYNERLAREFIKQGYQVEIETFTIQYPSILFPGKTQYAEWDAPEGLNIKRTVNSINPLNWIKVGKQIQKEKPDILMVRYWLPFMAPCLGTVCRKVRKNKHTKVLCLADNIVPHEKRPGDKILTSYFMNSIDGMVAMSESVLADMKSFRPDLKHALCPHPLFDNFGDKIESSKAKELLALDSKINYLLFFGFIRDYKGLDLLLNAFADDRLKQLPLKLIVAGEFYTDSKPYFELIEKTSIIRTSYSENRFHS